jgi:predicted phosphodiesterase
MYGMKRLIEIIEAEKTNGVALTILSISDLHIPFQLNYELLKDYRNKIDILQLNGDIVDCQAFSKFSKQYRISPME